MSDTDDGADAPHQPSVAPTLKLSRRGLVFSLLAAAIAGLSVYATFPESVGGSPLPVDVRIDRQPVATADGVGAVITGVLVVQNLSDHEIPKLTIKINRRYLLIRDSPLQEKERIVIPLQVFTDKRSSQRYDPLTNPPQELLVTGQLPSGARGLRHFDFDGGQE